MSQQMSQRNRRRGRAGSACSLQQGEGQRVGQHAGKQRWCAAGPQTTREELVNLQVNVRHRKEARIEGQGRWKGSQGGPGAEGGHRRSQALPEGGHQALQAYKARLHPSMIGWSERAEVCACLQRVCPACGGRAPSLGGLLGRLRLQPVLHQKREERQEGEQHRRRKRRLSVVLLRRGGAG